MNQNFTLTALAEPITSLPDTPTCAADELKRRFQAPADEVREAHNALAEAHEKLGEKVESVVGETFTGLIDESMLNEELAEKLNNQANQTALDVAKSENEVAHAGFQAKITAKCEIVTGAYNGRGKNNTKMISLGFTPKAVLVANWTWTRDYHNPQRMNLAATGVNAENVSIVSNGFQVRKYFNLSTEDSVDDCLYRFAFK